MRKLQRRAVARMLELHPYLRRARLRVPAAELGQIHAGAIFDGFDEILACRSFAIVTIEIEVGPAAEPLFASHGPHHANDFGALVVDGRRVEIAYLAIGIGPDRMREGTGILGELYAAQYADILDALDRRTAHILAEQLVA